MAKKRSKLPQLKAFGAKLRALRGDRSREQISIALQHRGVRLDESTLVQYEKGTVWAPDPGALLGLAAVYDQSVTDLIRLLLLNRHNPDATAADTDRLFARGHREPDPHPQRLTGDRAPTEFTDRSDLGRHRADQRSTGEGGGDVPASQQATPVSRWTKDNEIEDLKARLSAAEDAAVQLLSIITGEEVQTMPAARSRKTEVRRRYRKTGG